MRPMALAYSHQGHSPRADQTGRIHISDFRFPANSLLRNAAGPYIRCLVPAFDGVIFSVEWKDALWAKFSQTVEITDREFGLFFVSGQVEASLLGQRLEFESNPKCRE